MSGLADTAVTDAEHPLAADLKAWALTLRDATDFTVAPALMLQAAATLTQQMQTIQSQDAERGQSGLRLEAMAREVVRLREALAFYARQWHRSIPMTFPVPPEVGHHYTISLGCGFVDVRADEGRAIHPDDPLLVQHRVARKALGLPDYFTAEEKAAWREGAALAEGGKDVG